MAKAKANCCCGGCKFKDTDCYACTRCKPRYLCASVVVTAGPYTTLTECCEEFGFRMDYQCGEGKIYSGGGSCADGISLSLEVELLDTAEGCTTVVSCPYLAYPLTYDGTLPAMVFTVENEAGDSLEVTIGEPNVVENPQAKVACAACSCASCLPGALCLQVVIYPHFIHDPETCLSEVFATPYQRVAIVTPFNCDTGIYDPVSQAIEYADYPDETKQLEMSFAWIPKEDGCGIRITGSLTMGAFGVCIAGGDASFDEILLLDNGIDPRRFHGTECESNRGITHTLGTPELLPCPEGDPDCAAPNPQSYISFIDTTLVLLTYTGYNAGEVRVMDGSCGACVACLDPIPELCCPSLPDELQISLQNAGGDTGSTSGVLTRGGEGNSWSGTFIVGPDGQYLYVSVICVSDAITYDDPDMPTDGWYLVYTGCAIDARTVVPLGETHPEDVDPTPPSALFDCNPLLIEHTILMGSGCSCWTGCDTGTIEIVITA